MSPRILLLWLLLHSLALPAACPEFLPTEPTRLTLKHQQQTVQAELSWAAASSEPAELQVLGAADQQLLASIALNHPAFSGSFVAQPLAEDADLDGLADHLWLVNQQGLIWRAALSGNQLGTPVLLADLSGLGLQFRYSVSLLRTRLPARLAPAVWQNLEQHLLLLLGRDPQSGQTRMCCYCCVIALIRRCRPLSRALSSQIALSCPKRSSNLRSALLIGVICWQRRVGKCA